jgi:hypothetical protein
MKILIVAMGRTGSTNLMRCLSETLNLELIAEPFNTHFWRDLEKREPTYKEGDPIPDNCVFKTMIDHNPKWLNKNVKNFSHVIVLVRANIRELCISGVNATKYGYYHEYEPTEFPYINNFVHESKKYKKLFQFAAFHPKSKLVFYEDLYNKSSSIVENTVRWMNLGITKEQFNEMRDGYLSPSKRLRKI